MDVRQHGSRGSSGPSRFLDRLLLFEGTRRIEFTLLRRVSQFNSSLVRGGKHVFAGFGRFRQPGCDHLEVLSGII